MRGDGRGCRDTLIYHPSAMINARFQVNGCQSPSEGHQRAKVPALLAGLIVGAGVQHTATSAHQTPLIAPNKPNHGESIRTIANHSTLPMRGEGHQCWWV